METIRRYSMVIGGGVPAGPRFVRGFWLLSTPPG